MVFSQQSVLTVLALAQLGLTGLGIDYIRYRVLLESGAPHFPLGWQPPVLWPPITLWRSFRR